MFLDSCFKKCIKDTHKNFPQYDIAARGLLRCNFVRPGTERVSLHENGLALPILKLQQRIIIMY